MVRLFIEDPNQRFETKKKSGWKEKNSTTWDLAV
jgi:hypothetical protein